MGTNEATHLLETAPPARPPALEAAGNGRFAPCPALILLLGEYRGAAGSLPCQPALPQIPVSPLRDWETFSPSFSANHLNHLNASFRFCSGGWPGAAPAAARCWGRVGRALSPGTARPSVGKGKLG